MLTEIGFRSHQRADAGIQVGVAEIALAQTVVGRFLGASTAAGVKAKYEGICW
jgi:hypothetical protein